MEYGVVDEGFRSKSRQQIAEGMKNKARQLYGSDADLSDGSPLGMFIRLMSWELYRKWMESEDNYNSAFIDSATGDSLDKVAQYIGITRRKATKSLGKVTFYGDEDTSIPQGTKVSTSGENPILFETLQTTTIGVEEEVDIKVRAIEKGLQGNVGAGSITEIMNPISGVSEVNNEDELTGGNDDETDFLLRKRYKESVDKPGGATLNSIRANILQIEGANACIILENVTDEEDGNGLPPKSFEPIVLGGVDFEVAKAIFEMKPAGVQTFGGVTEELIDASGLTKQVSFSRATRKDIYVGIDLQTGSNTLSFEEEESVKEKIFHYINSLSLSEKVIATRIISECYKVTSDIEDVTVRLGVEPQPTQSDNIDIGFREVARVDIENIDIQVVE